MNKVKIFLFFVSLLAATFAAVGQASPSAAAADAPQFKQIAAVPGDFDMLRLPNPAEQGTKATSAMIPVYLTPNAKGELTWSGQAWLDSTANVRVMVLANGQTWSVTAQNGNQTTALKAGIAGVERHVENFGLESKTYPAEVYILTQAQTGALNLQVTAPAGSKLTAAGQPDGYLVVGSDSDYQLYTHLSSYNLLQNGQVALVTRLFTEEAAAFKGLTEATAVVRAPSGTETTLTMVDDGAHADGAAGDGVFGAWLNLSETGEYTARVSGLGYSANNQKVFRTTQHVFPVIAPRFGATVQNISTAVAGNRLNISFSLPALNTLSDVEQAQLVNASAEVWGVNAEGKSVAVAWIGGLVQPVISKGQATFTMNLDGRWLALAGAGSQLELRNLRIQDVNTSLPLVQVANLSVKASALPSNASEMVTAITEEMYMGSKPAELNRSQSYVGGNKVILSHGYCSGSGTWPTAHFTNYAVFSDLNQNRTHDQFANLIRNFGSQFDSFGLIAHSQGGAASLHLYTYYWSGLDNSSGSRLIQSVGTPYQGTALAGNLAILGQIFGAGCGTNWDLSYDGASVWLAGIPSWARSRVYFHTTSFKDVWYAYDYCNIATDVFLGDPDDGVIEKSRGQLSGANNMGHATQQCHTQGMRDPAQTHNASRNANMNTYANR